MPVDVYLFYIITDSKETLESLQKASDPARQSEVTFTIRRQLEFNTFFELKGTIVQLGIQGDEHVCIVFRATQCPPEAEGDRHIVIWDFNHQTKTGQLTIYPLRK